MDPDCCIQSPCQNSPLCRGARDPLQVIQQTGMAQPRIRSFYDRVKMLVGRDSTHIIPGENPFNSRYTRTRAHIMKVLATSDKALRRRVFENKLQAFTPRWARLAEVCHCVRGFPISAQFLLKTL